MKCLPLVGLILIAFPIANPVLSAQKPRLSSTVSELLDSQNPLDRAWGAYAVGEFYLAGLLPRVTEILQRESDAFVLREALDAAIRLHAVVADGTLFKLYKGYPEETTILFAEAAGDHLDSMLALFGSETDTVHWLALGNLLLQARAPGLARAVMKDMERMRIYVRVSEQDNGFGYGGGCGRGVGLALPPDAPPAAYYMFTDGPSETTVLAFPGPHPIYYERLLFVRGGDTPDFPHIPCFLERDSLRFEYLAALLDLPAEDVKFETTVSLNIVWRGPDQYAQCVIQVCNQVLRQYQTLAGRLAALGLLSDSETDGLHPVVRLQVDDVREDGAIPLPELKLSARKLPKPGRRLSSVSAPSGSWSSRLSQPIAPLRMPR